jgi:hypothetical protein
VKSTINITIPTKCFSDYLIINNLHYRLESSDALDTLKKILDAPFFKNVERTIISIATDTNKKEKIPFLIFTFFCNNNLFFTFQLPVESMDYDCKLGNEAISPFLILKDLSILPRVPIDMFLPQTDQVVKIDIYTDTCNDDDNETQSKWVIQWNKEELLRKWTEEDDKYHNYTVSSEIDNFSILFKSRHVFLKFPNVEVVCLPSIEMMKIVELVTH